VEHRRLRIRHLYYFRGQLRCGLCDRKMQGQRSNGEAYYRCRYAQEYALANTVDHPRNVYLRERQLLSALRRGPWPGRSPRTAGPTRSPRWPNTKPSPPPTTSSRPVPNSPAATPS
jgi:hypothetical protein